MTVLGSLATVAAPVVAKAVLQESEPLPVSDAALEAEYIRARTEMEAWKLEDGSDLKPMLLSGAVGFIAALMTPR
jgi:ferric-dicitrate binding protein FerR (iron transport regulator)